MTTPSSADTSERPARQTSGLDCVRAIGLYLDQSVDPDALWRDFASAQDGFDRQAVVRSLQAMGLRVHLRPSTAAHLRRAVFPALIEWRDGSFALLGRVAQDQAYLQVPGESGMQCLPLAQLLPRLAPHWMAVATHEHAGPSERFGPAWFVGALLRHKALLGETVLASMALQVFALISPFAFQVVIDKVLVHRGLGTLDVIVLGLAISSLFEVVLTALRTYVLTHTTHRVDAELGARIFAHLMALPMTFFASRRVGEVLARVREMEGIRAFLTGTGLGSGVDLVFTVFFLAVMAHYSPALTWVVVASLPLFLGISVVLMPLLHRHVEDRFARAAENQAFLVEAIAGVETIKSMNAQARFQRQWEERLAAYVRASFKTGHLANLTQQGVQLVNKALGLVLLWLGARLVLAGDLTVGQLIAFNMLAARVSAPILRLSTLWQEFQQMRVSMQRLGDILDAPAEVPAQASQTLDRLQGQVCLDAVSFRYRPDGRDILRQISLTVQPGELVGIVGSSGSGKSTLAKLLLRLYLPSSGRILLDGADLVGMHPAQIRRQVTVVTQEVTLFSRSVRDNVAMGQVDARLEDIVQAAKLAGADDFIRKLPQGYDTVLGERGTLLSGGQRQRIAIARALLLQPRVLILDEATSMLDADTEMRFWAQIRRIARERTVLAITHRLSSVLDMDRILVLEDGVLVEEGAPTALLRQAGRFADLYRLQMGGVRAPQEASP